MARVNREDLDVELIVSAKALLDHEPVEQRDFGHASYFVENRTPWRFGGTLVRLSEGAHGGGVGEEAYRSDVELRFNRKGDLRSVTEKSFFDYPYGRPVGDAMWDKVDSIAGKFSPTRRQEQRKYVAQTAKRFVARALAD